MQQIVGLGEFQRKLQSFFNLVVESQQPLIIVSGLNPKAVLIAYEDFVRYQQLQDNEILAKFDDVWTRLDGLNTQAASSEIESDILDAREH